MVMAGHMSNEVIRALILKALMPLVFIRTFPSSLLQHCNVSVIDPDPIQLLRETLIIRDTEYHFWM